MMELSEPFNWCDRRCERFPLSPTCPVVERGERDRHLPLVEAIEALLHEAIASCMSVLGDDAVVARPPPPLSVEAECLVGGSGDYVVALRERGERGASVACLVVLAHGKVARFSGELADVGGEVWEMDVVPNLLLLEQILDEFHAAVAPSGERIATREHMLRVLLAPLFGTIPRAAREIMERLVAWNLAPPRSREVREVSGVRTSSTETGTSAALDRKGHERCPVPGMRAHHSRSERVAHVSERVPL